MNREHREKFASIAYYLIIALVSVLVMAFMPMVGTEIGLEWQIPDTTIGWIVWVTTKVAIACVNMLIYHCFLQQAKVNVRDDEHYKDARKILQEASIQKHILPDSPKRWTIKQYTGKGTSLFLSSILSTVAFTQAILTFDILTFMSLAFTLIMGIIFGYINMRKAEEYWTTEYYEYAVMIQNQVKFKEKWEDVQN